MEVTLLHHTPLWVASTAIRKCWASEEHSDTCNTNDNIGTKDRELIHRVGNKNKHSSTLEHLNYSFDIDGISRACLQELARHRHASLSVKSSRYTLKELKKEEPFVRVYKGEYLHDVIRAEKYIVLTHDSLVNEYIINSLDALRQAILVGISNDESKYCMPEAYRTSLVWTVNARALQNFLSLRTDKAALWEIRNLAYEVYNKLPEQHKYLFKEYVKERE